MESIVRRGAVGLIAVAFLLLAVGSALAFYHRETDSRWAAEAPVEPTPTISAFAACVTDHLSDVLRSEQTDELADELADETQATFDIYTDSPRRGWNSSQYDYLYDATLACGVDFRAFVDVAIEERMVGNSSDRVEPCTAAVTNRDIKEYGVALLKGAETTDSFSSPYKLWRRLGKCLTGQSSGITVLPGTPEPPATGSSGGGGSEDWQDDVESCLAFADEQADVLLDMLYAGEITDQQYNEMMAETGVGCFDL